VRCRDLTHCTDEVILKELGRQGVTKTFNITVKDGQSQRKTNSFILTFNSSQPPKHITVGYERIPVSLYTFLTLTDASLVNNSDTLKRTV